MNRFEGAKYRLKYDKFILKTSNPTLTCKYSAEDNFTYKLYQYENPYANSGDWINASAYFTFAGVKEYDIQCIAPQIDLLLEGNFKNGEIISSNLTLYFTCSTNPVSGN